MNRYIFFTKKIFFSKIKQKIKIVRYENCQEYSQLYSYQISGSYFNNWLSSILFSLKNRYFEKSEVLAASLHAFAYKL